ncbi:MAG: BatD family protein [Chitinophagales bacterium]
MKQIILTFLIGLLILSNLQAQTFEVSPKSVQVREGSRFEVSYTLQNANMDDFQAPDLSSFFIVSGPNKQQSVQIIQGKMTQSASIIYVLSPKKQGVFNIPSATVTSNRKTLRSGKVKVVVSKGSAKTQQQGRKQGRMQTDAPTVDVTNLKSLIFLRIITDTLDAYQGQQVNAYYRLYTAVDVTDYTIIGTPQLTGFWVQDLTPQRLESGNIEMIDSVSYRTYNLKEYALFPQRSGALTITPMEVEIVAQIPVGNQRRSFFRSNRREKIKLSSDTLDINIYPFPEEGKPESFAGGVGNYKMSVKLDRSAIREGETAQMTMIINGEGNVKLLEAPELTVKEGLETFEPEIEESTYTQSGKVKGRKTFTFDILANEQGRYDIGPIEFSYFHPQTQEYRTIRSPKYKLVVMKGDGTALPEETAEDTGIRPIKMETTLHKKGGKVFASIWFWTLFLLPFLIFPFFLQWHRRREAILSDTISLKRRLALQVAGKRLTTAEGFMKQNNKQGFYNEVVKTIWDYLSDKLNLQTTDLSKDNIRSLLEEKNVPSAIIDKLIETIRYCEMALFAPVADADNLQGTYTDTQNLIADLEEAV